ncbi:hypothetical protein EBS80_00800 [bacterium]|nr:hypothetical protein [bacterium]
MENGEVLLEAEKEYQKQYRLSRWWIEHRDGLKRLGVIAFACVDGIILLIAGWALLDGFIISEPEETRAVLELAAYGQNDLHAYAEARKAKDLTIGAVTAVPSSEGKFDLYATVTNPNANWWGEFTYAFASSAGTTDTATAFVLPNSEKPDRRRGRHVRAARDLRRGKQLRVQLLRADVRRPPAARRVARGRYVHHAHLARCRRVAGRLAQLVRNGSEREQGGGGGGREPV